MKHKVAVIGAGYFGQRHIKTLLQMEDTEIVGIVDKDINRANEIASQFGLKVTQDYRYLLDKAETFFIVTPTHTHSEIAEKLIEAEKNIFIEKPITENPQEASFLIKKALQKGIIFQVGLIERFNPVIKTLMEHINNPLFISAQRLSPFLGRATDTAVTFDLMIHDLDLIWKILKTRGNLKLIDLKAFTKRLITDKYDFATAWLELEVDSKILKTTLTASRINFDYQRIFSIIEEDFTIHADLIKKTIMRIDGKGNLKEIEVKERDKQPLFEEIRDFLNCVRKKTLSKIAPTPDEIIEVLKIIRKINGGTADETIH